METVKLKCGACGSSSLRPATLGINTTGRPRDHQVSIEATCLDCGSVEDVGAGVAEAVARGATVFIGAYRVRVTRGGPA